MPGIKVRENEGFEQALRRFKRGVEKAGTLGEIRRREFYEPDSVRRQRAKAAAIKRARKKQMRDFQGPRTGAPSRSSSRTSSNTNGNRDFDRNRDN